MACNSIQINHVGMSDGELRDNVGALHASRVEETLAELQQLMREHEVALQRVWWFVTSSVGDRVTHIVPGAIVINQPPSRWVWTQSITWGHESGV